MMLDKDSNAAASIVFTSYCGFFSASFKEGKKTFIHVSILYEIVFKIYFGGYTWRNWT